MEERYSAAGFRHLDDSIELVYVSTRGLALDISFEIEDARQFTLVEVLRIRKAQLRDFEDIVLCLEIRFPVEVLGLHVAVSLLCEKFALLMPLKGTKEEEVCREELVLGYSNDITDS